VVSEWQSDRWCDESTIRRHFYRQLHDHCHEWRLQQFTFRGDRSHCKPDTANTDNHTEWINNILPGRQRNADFEQRKWEPMVSERHSNRRCDESTICRHFYGQLHHDNHEWRLQQFTFDGNDGYGKSDAANTNDHTEWINNILSGRKRDTDFEQRKWEPVVPGRQSNRRCDESTIRRHSFR